MRRLVALDLPAAPAFVDAIKKCFDAGDAITPLDQRLDAPARDRVLRALQPTHIIGREGELRRLEGGKPADEDDAVVIATSGTTGEQKAVVLTTTAIRASAAATNAALAVDAEADHWVCALPLSHVGGLSVVLRALDSGTPLTLLDRFDVDRYEQALTKGATLTSLVPTTLARLGTPRSDRFRVILLGGSAMPETLADNVVTTYGMTETGSGVVYGGFPLRDVEIKVLDSGEIALRCPMLLRCYRDGVDPKDTEGYFPTGDAGYMDETGRLVVHGRTGDLIISGGENVWPTAIEHLLAGLPGVQEIGIAGVADREWGQRVVGIVVASNGETPEISELNDRCRAEIGPWATLKALRVVDALPRTAIGKLDRRALARLANEA